MYAMLWASGIALGLSYLLMPWYIFLAVFLVLGLFITGFIKPEYSFYLVIFVFIVEKVHLFIDIEHLYSAKIYPFALPLLATAAGVMAAKASHRIQFNKTPIGKILVVIALAEAVSVIWAPSFYIGLALSVLLIIDLLLFYMPVNLITNEETLRRVVGVWIVAAVIASAGVVISQWEDYTKTYYITRNIGVQVAFGEHKDRLAGIAGGDHVAGFISMAMFLTLGAIASEKRRMVNLGYAILVLFMLYAIILTTSRGVFIGVGAAYIFYIIMHNYFKGKIIRYTFLFIICTLFIVLLGKPGYIDRMLIGFGYSGELYFTEGKSSFSSSEESGSVSGSLSGMAYRELMWKRGLNAMTKEPLKYLFGLGNGGFLYYSLESPEVNSISFAFFYDLGVFGILLLVFLLYVVTAYLYRCFRHGKKGYSYYMFLASVSAMIAETGIHGLVDYDLTSFGSKFFWFPLGFVMAVSNILRKESGLQ